tara:strand:+ start:403 stop:561 length:159 start_codon:yes stop_codon:yes gene_type:complete
MNNKIAKKIRQIINPQDEVTRRVYRRAKKQYLKTPVKLRGAFLESLSSLLGN